MSDKKIITVSGATGNEKGSIIDTVLARSELFSEYTLRGVTRDPASSKSKTLTRIGVEMVKADLDDVEAMKQAIKGSYGVFGQREIQQGKNIFEAANSQGVKHYVFCSLPYVEKLANGELKHVDHFDGKALVEEYIEENKRDMIAHNFMPAMFITFAKQQIKNVNGTPTLVMPFPSDPIAWPLLEPRRDSGKYVMGLFEAGSPANSARAHGISA
ncbi:hypothetical protein DOTSEDRAFT_76109 [Dothistroma septosporum NZE10]|uniref:NmrA-like domain-containing protein n=1 Tax=Dothistroma septosporum (strain NZE10 / CBS 128990) TaxID=675120 RepID=N1Q1V5_DOTSN|nr:hypothetical protein DOTSEDRAFT_76109 [Dothistroma septosporum NZE10]